MTGNVLVVDYGVGNVLSVCRAFEHCGATVKLSGEPDDILAADRIVLPGVGAIGHCMDELKQRKLIGPISEFSQNDRPFLGICVGMQLMMETSREFTERECLGWFPGNVIEVPGEDKNGLPHKIPHIGWSSLKTAGSSNLWNGTILDGIEQDEAVYFVHSFMAEPADENSRLADTSYNGIRVCAALRRGALYGTQFHPEKSGTVGLRIIQNFVNL
jgi:imidazole glycerol-phosphate synthase subunit HisH